MAKLVINKDIAGANSGAKLLAKMCVVSQIQTDPELEKIFASDQKVLDSIVQSMNVSGYDSSEPIIIWKERGVVVDGHTRLKAAKIANIEEVPTVEKSFASFEEAKKYTEHRQLDRRNLTQAEIYAYAVNIDFVDDKTGEGRATERLAKKLGVSASTIEHARTIEKKAPQEIKEKIKQNEMTINQGYGLVREKKERKKIEQIIDIPDITNSSVENIEINDLSENMQIEIDESNIKTIPIQKSRPEYEEGYKDGIKTIINELKQGMEIDKIIERYDV